MEDGNGKVRPLARPPGCNKATTVGWPLCSSSPKVTQKAEDGPGREEGGKKDARLLWQQPATVCAAAAGIGGAATNARKESPRCTDGGSGLLGFGLRGLAKKK